MPRSRSMSIESMNWSRMSRGSTALVSWRIRSTSVLLPWSMWAMTEKLRRRDRSMGIDRRGYKGASGVLVAARLGLGRLRVDLAVAHLGPEVGARLVAVATPRLVHVHRRRLRRRSGLEVQVRLLVVVRRLLVPDLLGRHVRDRRVLGVGERVAARPHQLVRVGSERRIEAREVLLLVRR